MRHHLQLAHHGMPERGREHGGAVRVGVPGRDLKINVSVKVPQQAKSCGEPPGTVICSRIAPTALAGWRPWRTQR